MTPLPNRLPPDHDRTDFDFEYDNGVGPIYLPGYEGAFGHVEPEHVWCKRHGWEVALGTCRECQHIEHQRNCCSHIAHQYGDKDGEHTVYCPCQREWNEPSFECDD